MADTTTRVPNAAAVADRRGFLKRAGAGVVTAGATVLGAAEVKAADPAGTKPTDGGYRETEHIRQYYDSAR